MPKAERASLDEPICHSIKDDYTQDSRLFACRRIRFFQHSRKRLAGTWNMSGLYRGQRQGEINILSQGFTGQHDELGNLDGYWLRKVSEKSRRGIKTMQNIGRYETNV